MLRNNASWNSRNPLCNYSLHQRHWWQFHLQEIANGRKTQQAGWGRCRHLLYDGVSDSLCLIIVMEQTDKYLNFHFHFVLAPRQQETDSDARDLNKCWKTETNAAGTWRQDAQSMQIRNDVIPLWAIGGQIFSPYVLLRKLPSTLVPVKTNLSIWKYQNTPCSQSISPCRTVCPCLFTELPLKWINHSEVVGGQKDTWIAVSQLLVNYTREDTKLEGSLCQTAWSSAKLNASNMLYSNLQFCRV